MNESIAQQVLVRKKDSTPKKVVQVREDAQAAGETHVAVILERESVDLPSWMRKPVERWYLGKREIGGRHDRRLFSSLNEAKGYKLTL